MQGSRQGSDQTEQHYRDELRLIILESFPEADITCPGIMMRERLWQHESAIRNAHTALKDAEEVFRSDYNESLQRLTGIFHELVDLSAAADFCIAYLPNHEASMGTAIEMFAAHRAGKRVIAVTEMRQNLAVLACSDVIVPNLDGLQKYLAQLARVPAIQNEERSEVLF